MADGGLKYFIAVLENKKRDRELKLEESKIDDLQKRMLTRYWKEKFDILDEIVRLNVRTPAYKYHRDSSAASSRSGEQTGNTISLGAMKIDAKLLGNKPVTLQRPKKAGPSRMEPVISIVGNEAICYPNKDALRGRKVELAARVVRRIEECRHLSNNLRAMQLQTISRRDGTSSPFPPLMGPPRPITAPNFRSRTRSAASGGRIRTVKSAVVRTRSTRVTTPRIGITAIAESETQG